MATLHQFSVSLEDNVHHKNSGGYHVKYKKRISFPREPPELAADTDKLELGLEVVWAISRFPHLFRNEIQGLSKNKITLSKYYWIIIWHIVNALFCDEITCHTPNYNIYSLYFNYIQPTCYVSL